MSIDFLWASLPLLFLIGVMSHPRGLSAPVALPCAAFLSLFIALFRFSSPAALAFASTVAGVLAALTPLSIVFGAMLLFSVLKETRALNVITDWVASLTTHPVAQLMLIGWAFPFLIEGISGFGTPAALAAPLLVGLGFPPLKACLMTLIANTVPVTFGAMGTPVWFGLRELNLTTSELRGLAADLGSIQLLCTVFVPALALSQVLCWREVIRNWRFVVASSAACGLPFWLAAQISYEFPSVVGGVIGFLSTIGLARIRWGLKELEVGGPELEAMARQGPVRSRTVSSLVLASSPIWLSILVLLLTRVEAVGLKRLLTSPEGGLRMAIPNVGDFSLSPSLVASLDITWGGQAVLMNWTQAFLYVPSIVPFVLVSFLFVLIWPGAGWSQFRACCHSTLTSLVKPSCALFGALVLVKVMMTSAPEAPAMITLLGRGIAGALGESWNVFAVYLGVLGSFFSGSATVSNLTFGSLQYALGLEISSVRSVLALQVAGAALGNMICLHNIIAVTTILGLRDQDSVILRKNFLILVALSLVTTVGTALIVTR